VIQDQCCFEFRTTYKNLAFIDQCGSVYFLHLLLHFVALSLNFKVGLIG